MASHSPPSSASPPGPLQTLYPLACILVGPEAAPDLLLRVYREAAALLPAERPNDLDEWLLALLRATSGEGTPSTTETAPLPKTDTPTPNSLRREVAEQRAEEVLPAALAICSPQERLLLAVDAVGEAEDTRASRLAHALDTTPANARSALWANLRALLSEPEFALVENAISDAFLLDAVRDLIVARYASAPSSLRSRLRKTMESARADTAPDAEKQDSSEDASRNRRLSPPRPRTLLFTILLGVLVLAGGIGVWYATQSSPTPSSSSTSLIAFSIEQFTNVRPDVTTKSRAEAEAYVESTWNRQIQAPDIRDIRLQGVGRARTAGGVEIPVLLYVNADDSSRIATFAYSYALVDQIESTATLDTGVREALAQRHHLVSDAQDGEQGLLWRNRDDIFVVVAPSLPTDSLGARVRP